MLYNKLSVPQIFLHQSLYGVRLVCFDGYSFVKLVPYNKFSVLNIFPQSLYGLRLVCFDGSSLVKLALYNKLNVEQQNVITSGPFCWVSLQLFRYGA